jgi:hypothetical protein
MTVVKVLRPCNSKFVVVEVVNVIVIMIMPTRFSSVSRTRKRLGLSTLLQSLREPRKKTLISHQYYLTLELKIYPKRYSTQKNKTYPLTSEKKRISMIIIALLDFNCFWKNTREKFVDQHFGSWNISILKSKYKESHRTDISISRNIF